MKTTLLRWTGAALILAGTGSLASCVYDPYYGGGYGSYAPDDGGYYGPSVRTTLVVTSDSRWGYDRSRYCYYDYHRRCYYDPYLRGYYPVGYVPAVIYGAPHPYGWYPGRGVCPPPRNVYWGHIPNYRNRVELLRERNYAWASAVRERRQENLERFRENRQENLERIRDNRQNNLERLRDNRQENLERFRENRADNLERIRENKQVNLERFRENRAANLERIQENRAALRERNQQKLEAYREKVRDHRQRSQGDNENP